MSSIKTKCVSFTTEQKANNGAPSLRTPTTTTSVIVAVLPLTTLLLGLVASSTRLVLWRARMIAQSLDDAFIIRHIFWNSETMMVNYCIKKMNLFIIYFALRSIFSTYTTALSDLGFSLFPFLHLTPFMPVSTLPRNEVRLLRWGTSWVNSPKCHWSWKWNFGSLQLK